MKATAPADRDAAHRAAARRVAHRFKPHSYARGYAGSKLRLDPVYRVAAESLAGTPLPLLDIGCGMGLLGLYLHERGLCDDYLGLDIDPRKLHAGAAALAGAPASLRLGRGDAADMPPHHGHVALLDVLHYMPLDAQAHALRQAAGRVAPCGALLIRTCLADHGWRFRATQAEEWLLHACGWMRRDGTRSIPQRAHVEGALRKTGLAFTSRPLWGITPFNSHLFIARRPADAAAAGTVHTGRPPKSHEEMPA